MHKTRLRWFGQQFMKIMDRKPSKMEKLAIRGKPRRRPRRRGVDEINRDLENEEQDFNDTHWGMQGYGETKKDGEASLTYRPGYEA